MAKPLIWGSLLRANSQPLAEAEAPAPASARRSGSQVQTLCSMRALRPGSSNGATPPQQLDKRPPSANAQQHRRSGSFSAEPVTPDKPPGVAPAPAAATPDAAPGGGPTHPPQYQQQPRPADNEPVPPPLPAHAYAAAHDSASSSDGGEGGRLSGHAVDHAPPAAGPSAPLPPAAAGEPPAGDGAAGQGAAGQAAAPLAPPSRASSDGAFVRAASLADGVSASTLIVPDPATQQQPRSHRSSLDEQQQLFSLAPPASQQGGGAGPASVGGPFGPAGQPPPPPRSTASGSDAGSGAAPSPARFSHSPLNPAAQAFPAPRGPALGLAGAGGLAPGAPASSAADAVDAYPAGGALQLQDVLAALQGDIGLTPQQAAATMSVLQRYSHLPTPGASAAAATGAPPPGFSPSTPAMQWPAPSHAASPGGGLSQLYQPSTGFAGAGLGLGAFGPPGVAPGLGLCLGSGSYEGSHSSSASNNGAGGGGLAPGEGEAGGAAAPAGSQSGQTSPFASGANALNSPEAMYGVDGLDVPGTAQVAVHNVPFKWCNADLEALFKHLPGFLDAQLLFHENGRSKGVGVALFADRAAASEVCSRLSGAQADGRKLELVLMSPDNHISFSCKQVAVLGLPWEYTAADVRALIEAAAEADGAAAGDAGLETVDVAYRDDGKSEGRAIATFRSRRQAHDAITRLHGRETLAGLRMRLFYLHEQQQRQHLLVQPPHSYTVTSYGGQAPPGTGGGGGDAAAGRPAADAGPDSDGGPRRSTDGASTEAGGDQEGSDSARSSLDKDQGPVILHVSGLMESVTREQLRELFSQAGEVTKVDIPDGGRSMGYGFITFSNPQAAEQAMLLFNNYPLSGGAIHVAYSTSATAKARQQALRQARKATLGWYAGGTGGSRTVSMDGSGAKPSTPRGGAAAAGAGASRPRASAPSFSADALGAGAALGGIEPLQGVPPIRHSFDHPGYAASPLGHGGAWGAGGGAASFPGLSSGFGAPASTGLLAAAGAFGRPRRGSFGPGHVLPSQLPLLQATGSGPGGGGMFGGGAAGGLGGALPPGYDLAPGALDHQLQLLMQMSGTAGDAAGIFGAPGAGAGLHGAPGPSTPPHTGFGAAAGGGLFASGSGFPAPLGGLGGEPGPTGVGASMGAGGLFAPHHGGVPHPGGGAPALLSPAAHGAGLGGLHSASPGLAGFGGLGEAPGAAPAGGAGGGGPATPGSPYARGGGPPGAAAPGAPGGGQRQVVVRGLPMGLDDTHLGQLFAICGPLVAATKVPDQDLGFVTYQAPDSALRAVQILDGTQMPSGSTLSVAFAAPPPGMPGTSAGGGSGGGAPLPDLARRSAAADAAATTPFGSGSLFGPGSDAGAAGGTTSLDAPVALSGDLFAPGMMGGAGGLGGLHGGGAWDAPAAAGLRASSPSPPFGHSAGRAGWGGPLFSPSPARAPSPVAGLPPSPALVARSSLSGAAQPGLPPVYTASPVPPRAGADSAAPGFAPPGIGGLRAGAGGLFGRHVQPGAGAAAAQVDGASLLGAGAAPGGLPAAGGNDGSEGEPAPGGPFRGSEAA